MQTFVDRRDCIAGIRPEEAAPKITASISGNDGIKDIPPALGLWTFPLRRPLRSSMPSWLNKKSGVSRCSRNARSRRTLPGTHGSG